MSVTDKIAVVNFVSPDMSDSTTAYPIECWNEQIWIVMLSEHIYYSFSPGPVILSATCVVTHLSQVMPWIMQLWQKANNYYILPPWQFTVGLLCIIILKYSEDVKLW